MWEEYLFQVSGVFDAVTSEVCPAQNAVGMPSHSQSLSLSVWLPGQGCVESYADETHLNSGLATPSTAFRD